MRSTLGLAQDLFNLEHKPLQYFLSYKCSQDHLDHSCLRGRGGWNNNPNVSQLRWSLRQLLFRNSVRGSVSANCINFDSGCTPTFEFRTERFHVTGTNEEKENFDFTLLDGVNGTALSDFQANVLYYVAGFVTRKLVNTTVCSDCVNILFFRKESLLETDHIYSSSSDSFKKFTSFSSKGGLVHAADIVFRVIEFVEKHYRALVNNGSLLLTNNVENFLRNAAVQKFSSNLQDFQPPHPAAEELISEDIHEIQIVKGIVNQFLKCRMPHHAKLYNESLQTNKLGLRQRLTKLILFHNQSHQMFIKFIPRLTMVLKKM